MFYISQSACVIKMSHYELYPFSGSIMPCFDEISHYVFKSKCNQATGQIGVASMLLICIGGRGKGFSVRIFSKIKFLLEQALT